MRSPGALLLASLLILGPCAGAPAAQDAASVDWGPVLAGLGLVDVQTTCPDVVVELKYATADNFLGRNVYGSLTRCYLVREAALKLADAQKRLTALKPGWRLKIFDGARPRRIQAAMWETVKGTPQQPYVANPETGSMHNHGAAVDLSLVDDTGREADMGTPFDFFGDLAQPRWEEKFLEQGRLTAAQVANRRLLRTVMSDAGFLPISGEWWHFDAFPKDEVRRRFKIIE
jgi:D-alanyl-D-alanine dipeptidase